MNNRQIALALSLTILIGLAAAVTSCSKAESRKAVSLNEGAQTGNQSGNQSGNQESTMESNVDPKTNSTISSSSDPDSVTVSHTAEGPAHELTMEEMLLAQPMPMSGEEREFVFSHKSVQKLHEWNLKDYLDYTSVPLGRQQIWAEGQRWLSIRKMVRAQAEFTRNFLAGKANKPKPLPKVSRPQEPSADTVADPNVQNEQNEQNDSSTSSGTNAGSANAGVSSPGYAGDDGGGSDSSSGTPSMNLEQHNSSEDLFLSNQSVLTGAQAENTFNQLKKLRTDISTYCTELEELKKKAAQRKLTKKLEDAINSVSWD